MTTDTRTAAPGPTSVRKSLPLSERDLADLSRLTDDPSYRSALADLGVTVTAGSSDAKVLHALVRIALDVVRERVVDEGYAALAQDTDYLRESRAIARRRPLEDQ